MKFVSSFITAPYLDDEARFLLDRLAGALGVPVDQVDVRFLIVDGARMLMGGVAIPQFVISTPFINITEPNTIPATGTPYPQVYPTTTGHGG